MESYSYTYEIKYESIKLLINYTHVIYTYFKHI